MSSIESMVVKEISKTSQICVKLTVPKDDLINASQVTNLHAMSVLDKTEGTKALTVERLNFMFVDGKLSGPTMQGLQIQNVTSLSDSKIKNVEGICSSIDILDSD